MKAEVSSARQISRSDVVISGLGSSGDGIALIEGRTVFIPGALAGETVAVSLEPDGKATLTDVQVASPARISPACSLFGTCGGCSLQTLRADALLDWKASRVEAALISAGLKMPHHLTHYQTPPATRRRVDLGIKRVAGGVLLGLHRRNGDPVDMTECSVLDPTIFALLSPLREALSSLGALTGKGTLQINLLTSGPDLILGTEAELSASDRKKLAAFALEHKIKRIAWRSLRQNTDGFEIVAQHGPVEQVFGSLHISPPPGMFLQATLEGEEAIVDAVKNGLPSLNRKDLIIELYAGGGTLSGPLSGHGRVEAYEGHSASVAALRRAQVGHRLNAQSRDLVRQPLLARDLAAARVIILDPPHSGAARQIQEITASNVKDVIYVSCNPQALSRDAQALGASGYEILEVTIIDQFLWSADVEAVVTFTKDAKRLRRSRAA